MNGVLNIYKEKGYTSQDAVSVARKALGRVKAGHTGTLDPQAEGVLPICIGKATKIADYIEGGKSYRAVLKLGATTDTGDLTGNILTECPVNVSREELENAMRGFLGETLQTPPMYSAVKVRGKKLYELARAGKTVERASRIVNIWGIQLIEYDMSEHVAVMDVSCSKGTYIRSLCEDIGHALKCGGCMGGLTRTRSGPFDVKGSVTLGTLKERAESGRVGELIHSIEETLGYKTVNAPEGLEKIVLNGGRFGAGGSLGVTGELVFAAVNGKTVGIYAREGDYFKPRVMLLGE